MNLLKLIVKVKVVWLAAVISMGVFTSTSVKAESLRNISEYNLQMNLGLKGYDPVSYFPEGCGQPQAGSLQFKREYQGVTYLFVSLQNADLFDKNQHKYEPTYGGWCAYAMSSGSKVDIQPMVYTINGNRLHFFVSRRAKQNFDADVSGHETRADGFWKQISGEEPRL